MAIEREQFRNWLEEHLNEEDFAEASESWDGFESENTSFRESAEARFNQNTTLMDEMKADISSLKAKNFDLLMQVEGSQIDDNVGNNGDEPTKDIHIADLFKKRD